MVRVGVVCFCHPMSIAHCIVFGRKPSHIAAIICAYVMLIRARNAKHHYGWSTNTYRDGPKWVLLVRFHPPQPAVETDEIAWDSMGNHLPFLGDDSRYFILWDNTWVQLFSVANRWICLGITHKNSWTEDIYRDTSNQYIATWLMDYFGVCWNWTTRTRVWVKMDTIGGNLWWQVLFYIRYLNQRLIASFALEKTRKKIPQYQFLHVVTCQTSVWHVLDVNKLTDAEANDDQCQSRKN